MSLTFEDNFSEVKGPDAIITGSSVLISVISSFIMLIKGLFLIKFVTSDEKSSLSTDKAPPEGTIMNYFHKK